MCNPRRIRVTATRDVIESWQVELERSVQLSDAVASELEVSYPFGGTLGARTRTVFEQALAAAPAWRESEGVHHLELAGGQVAYHPGSGELRVTTRLEDVVSVEGHAAERRTGKVAETARGRGVGRYYDDGEGGLSRSTAQRYARMSAEAEAEANARELAEAVRRRAEADSARAARDLERDVERAASADAARRLEEERTRARGQLEARNREQLQQVAEAGLLAVNAVLAGAYQNALLTYARERGATGVECVDSDGVISIQFEMEG